MQSKHLRRWGLGSHEVPFFVPRPEQRAEGARKGALEGPRGLPLRNPYRDTVDDRASLDVGCRATVP